MDRIDRMLYVIRGAILEVYHELGPGLLESVYEEALVYELKQSGFCVKTQQCVPVLYKGEVLSHDLRLDILVEDDIIIELKSVDALQKVHFKQLKTYMKLMNLQHGILVNFNSDDIMTSMYTLHNY